jgi:mRNA interferase RelE/StbE
VSEGRHYAIFVTSAARRHLNQFALPVAIAVYEHLTGPVAENPHRLGKPLDRPFDDVWTTRRGEYRVLYTIDDEERVVTVLAVAYRRDAYRPRLAFVRPVSRPERGHTV